MGSRFSGRVHFVFVALLLGLFFVAAGARGDEPVVTTLADYEDDSVAASIANAENVPATDCRVSATAIPARGQRSLVVEIGATQRNASAACDLRFRLATPFRQADRVATYAWISQGSVDLAFRVRDATGQVFETPLLPLNTRNRWVRLVADLAAKELEPVGSPGSVTTAPTSELAWPIQIQGYRIRAHAIGRQTVYLDDLEVEHRVSGAGMLRGEFKLDHPTHIYEPGALVRAAIVLENISRERALPLSVHMAWLRGDASELKAASAPVNLPASGADYRSRQPVDFSQRIADPGLYRLVARVRGPRWTTPAVFETTIAVSYPNRSLPRGRATFFGVQTNLMREPAADQLLEIDMAREIGVQLLALETPWRVIEPKPGLFDFTALDSLINRITQRDIAAMLVLTDPPDWLATRTADLWERQAAVFEALARRYGERISAYQPVPREPGRLSDADVAALARIEPRLTAVRPNIEICTPPILIPSDNPTAADLPTLPPDSGLQLAFETTGNSTAAIEALEEFARAHELDWTARHRWFHRAEPLADSGALHDAFAMLHHYVRGAREGVAGVVWYDLRDDTSDTRFPELMRGLAQRDFSPKSPLLGFANTVGMLHGLLYVGKVPGTPEEFDSALFIGGQRQVAVLCPKPNRILPAVVAPYQLVDGRLAVFDFDRRLRPLTVSSAPPLAETHHNPFFIILDALRAQATPQIGLARPWLRVPMSLYCGVEATLVIELDTPIDLRRSYLQVILPPNAPIESSVSSRALRAEAGKTLSFDVKLTRTGEQDLEPVALTIRVWLEGVSLTVPVTIHPLLNVWPVKSSQEVTDTRFALGHLSPTGSDEEESAFSVALHAAYQDRKLRVAVALPPDAPPDATLHLGLTIEGAETHAEVCIETPAQHPKLLPARGTTRDQVEGWRCHWVKGEKPAASFCDVTIPARALGIPEFAPETRLLLAARYVQPQPGGGTAPLILEWGQGLGGRQSTTGYRWLQLRPSDTD
ncbi:MAG: beta-galactosidase [Planctomycetes bacterium]|nr:beta-galactosidase [Planctomycetota bacterium]